MGALVNCISKVKYKTNKAARSACWKILEKKGRSLKPYYCALCDSYHLTKEKEIIIAK